MAPSTLPPKQAGFPPVSPFIITATKVLSIVRVAVGGACFFAPQLTCSLHDYHVPAPYLLFVRMIGAREAINGALLYTARDENESDGGRRSIRRALWVGIIADSTDIFSLLYGLAMGEVGTSIAGITGTGAIGAITLAAVMLRGLRPT
ncbi:hypothetical protein BKA59DRAFT_169492 [Fusarium tricinctum]|uniref:Uncharacterized protein n=1 Tax=Fusarium tricinctum TaxID=61284 RepID=A0A8K0RSX0_9HYPO|nr:hypothetical protein BKA59DRAFT_169492 [Fusarium tricinctum]